MRGAEVVIFGGSGFIGRSVVKRLAQKGANVRIICRQPNAAGHLKTLGDVGQVSLVALGGTSSEAILNACQRASHVVNLIGILAEGRPGDFQAIHGDLAGRIATAAKTVGAQAFVQVSAIGASEQSDSAYAKSKASGEAAVLEQLPNATIMRPSIVFGPGDGFFERFGDMATKSPFLPLVDGGKTHFQPVYVGDVADAIVASLDRKTEDSKLPGIFELGGPSIYTFKALLEYLLAVLGRRRFLLPAPSSLLRFPAAILEKLPNPMLTRDQLILLRYDNVVSQGAKTLLDLGIQPTPLEAIVPTYIKGYASTDANIG